MSDRLVEDLIRLGAQGWTTATKGAAEIMRLRREVEGLKALADNSLGVQVDADGTVYLLFKPWNTLISAQAIHSRLNGTPGSIVSQQLSLWIEDRQRGKKGAG